MTGFATLASPLAEMGVVGVLVLLLIAQGYLHYRDRKGHQEQLTKRDELVSDALKETAIAAREQADSNREVAFALGRLEGRVGL